MIIRGATRTPAARRRGAARRRAGKAVRHKGQSNAALAVAASLWKRISHAPTPDIRILST